MYRLHWAPDTGAFVIFAALEHPGAAYERVVVDMRVGGGPGRGAQRAGLGKAP